MQSVRFKCLTFDAFMNVGLCKDPSAGFEAVSHTSSFNVSLNNV